MNENTNNPINASEVSRLCRDFLEFKRATGLKYESEEKTLRYFIQYCRKNCLDDDLPEDIIYNWISESDNRSLKTRSNYAGTMTEWAKYVFSLGYFQLKIPVIRSPVSTAFIPHIFTVAETQAIWNTVDHIQPLKVYPNLHKCIPVLFRLLYACGLRISEALQITAGDIDFNTSVITLKHTKLDRERLIPLSDSLAKVMKIYLSERAEILKKDSPIFYYRFGQVLTAGTVYKRFRMILQDSGIPYEGKLRGPRLHDFRHTFAVTTMNNLCAQGNDLYVTLPILSAYLGHAGVKSTERYIRLTEDRLSTIIDSVQIFLPNVFPGGKQDAEV